MFHQGEDIFCSLQLVGYIVIVPCIDQLLYPLCHLSRHAHKSKIRCHWFLIIIAKS